MTAAGFGTYTFGLPRGIQGPTGELLHADDIVSDIRRGTDAPFDVRIDPYRNGDLVGARIAFRFGDGADLRRKREYLAEDNGQGGPTHVTLARTPTGWRFSIDAYQPFTWAETTAGLLVVANATAWALPHRRRPLARRPHLLCPPLLRPAR